MSWSTAEHLQERFAALQRLASRQPNPPRNPNKPLTPFFITDILNGRVGIRNEPRTGIVRPWDDDTSSRSSSQDDGEEEIDVEDVKVPANNSVSPLDALFQMTSKTFDDTDSQHCNSADSSKRDQLSLFSKSQPPKKRRKSRTAFTNQQIYELEKRFLYQKYLTPADRDDIAQTLGLSNAQVITWFQNRRAKLKRDLEELKADVTAASSLGDNGTAVVIGSLEELEIYGRQELKNKTDTSKSDTDIQTDPESSPS